MTALFTPTELRDIDATYAEALLDTCQITNTSNRFGDEAAITARCAVLKPTRSTRGGGRTEPIGKDVDWTIAVPRGTDVRTNARVVVTESNRYPEIVNRSLRAGEIVRGGSYDPAIFIETIEANT